MFDEVSDHNSDDNYGNWNRQGQAIEILLFLAFKQRVRREKQVE